MREFGRSILDLLRRLAAWFAAAVLTWLVGIVGLYGLIIAPHLDPKVKSAVDGMVTDWGPAVTVAFLLIGLLLAFHQQRLELVNATKAKVPPPPVVRAVRRRTARGIETTVVEGYTAEDVKAILSDSTSRTPLAPPSSSGEQEMLRITEASTPAGAEPYRLATHGISTSGNTARCSCGWTGTTAEVGSHLVAIGLIPGVGPNTDGEDEA